MHCSFYGGRGYLGADHPASSKLLGFQVVRQPKGSLITRLQDHLVLDLAAVVKDALLGGSAPLQLRQGIPEEAKGAFRLPHNSSEL